MDPPPNTVNTPPGPPPLPPRGVLVEKDDVGPFPNEFVGLIPNMAPPDMEGFNLKVPDDADNCKQLSLEVGLPVFISKLVDEFNMVESSGPPTLKNCAVSPKLSKID